MLSRIMRTDFYNIKEVYERMIRIAYCGNDVFANCLNLLTTREDVKIIKLFVGASKQSGYSKQVVKLAKKHHIAYTFHPVSENDLKELFSEQKCDYILSAGYPYKIPIGAYQGVNLHPTLLPVGRGAWPFPRIILEGHTKSGTTLHKLNDRFDAGDIVLQREFPLEAHETQDTLFEKSTALGPALIDEWLSHPERLWQTAQPQPKSEYWKKLQAKDRTIDFNQNPEEINRMIHAFGKWGVIIQAENRKWLSRETDCRAETHAYKPGTILLDSHGELNVATNGGILYAAKVTEIKPPSFCKRAIRKMKSVVKKTVRMLLHSTE